MAFDKLAIPIVVLTFGAALCLVALGVYDAYRTATCPPDKLVAYEAISCYTVMVGVSPYQTPITNCTPYTAHRCEAE